MNRIAGVKRESRGDGHRSCSEQTDPTIDEAVKAHHQPNGRQAREHQRHPQGQHIAAKKGLKDEENIEMEGSVIILWVVTEVAGFGHLIDEPAVHALIKVRGLEIQRVKAE